MLSIDEFIFFNDFKLTIETLSRYMKYNLKTFIGFNYCNYHHQNFTVFGSINISTEFRLETCYWGDRER